MGRQCAYKPFFSLSSNYLSSKACLSTRVLLFVLNNGNNRMKLLILLICLSQTWFWMERKSDKGRERMTKRNGKGAYAIFVIIACLSSEFARPSLCTRQIPTLSLSLSNPFPILDATYPPPPTHSSCYRRGRSKAENLGYWLNSLEIALFRTIARFFIVSRRPSSNRFRIRR